VTRTVGWFTCVYPVLLRVEPGAETGERIKNVKEQLRAVPEGGLSYGVQRYLREDAEQKHGSDVVFNYLGQLDQVLGTGSKKRAAGGLIVGIASESTGAGEDPDAERQHVIEINGSVAGGQLRLKWSYSAEQYEASTIEQLAAEYQTELVKLIEHCRETTGGRTPSDFPLLKLNQQQLDKVIAKALKATERGAI
jgi:microcystin synthetase protein McyA